MLVITVDLWPHGNKEKARTLGVAHITNVGGGKQLGNYLVTVFKRGSTEEQRRAGKKVWKRFWVLRFPRLRLGCWDLLYRGLRDIVGSRNGD